MTNIPKSELVDVELWPKMTIGELYGQLSVLQERLFTATSMNNQPMADQIQKGIDHCNAILRSKTNGDDTITL